MTKRYMVGVDIGTLGTKSIVVSPQGEVLGSALAEYEVEHPRPLWAEQWPQVWEEATYQAIRQSLAVARVNSDDVAGICISGLYGGSGIPVDKSFTPLRPCLIWMDRRAMAQVAWIKKNADMDRVFEVTGNHVDTYFGYSKLLWVKENEPQIWARTHKFVPPSSYVEYKLTGKLKIDYSSAGNLGGLFDIHRLCWSEEMSRMLGISLEKMPEDLVSSTDIIGEVTSMAATKCGLSPGTPVIAGGIDAPMAMLSAGAVEEGDNVAMMGTSTCWGVIHRGDAFSRNLVSMPHVVNCTQEIYTWGGAATSGGLVRWFRDRFDERPQVAAGKTDENPYRLLDEGASKIPAGSDGLVVLPYFMGERAPLWDPDARGAILGLTLYHTKSHLFRAFLEAAAYSLRHSIEVGKAIGLHLKEETRIVGGVSKSGLWIRILADVLGRRVVTPAQGLGAPLGDALLAGIATGLVDDYRVIEQWTQQGAVTCPDPASKAVYDRYYALYRSFYADIKDDLHALSAIGGEQG